MSSPWKSRSPLPSPADAEALSPAPYREPAKHGWRFPQAEQEARAAEEWMARNPTRLPDRLRDVPYDGRSQAPRGLLERYLRDDARERSADDPQGTGRAVLQLAKRQVACRLRPSLGVSARGGPRATAEGGPVALPVRTGAGVSCGLESVWELFG